MVYFSLKQLHHYNK